MARLTKALHKRIKGYLDRAQKKTRTAYHFDIEAGSLEEFDGERDTIFQIARDGRGHEDRNKFWLQVNVASAVKMKPNDVYRLVGHEVIHAMLWLLSEAAEAHGTAAEKARAKDECENCTYQIQRALFGDVGEA